VSRDDALEGLRIRVERPVPPLVSAAEEDPVPARHHVEVAVERDVVDLGLRENERELSLDGLELFVGEERWLRGRQLRRRSLKILELQEVPELRTRCFAMRKSRGPPEIFGADHHRLELALFHRERMLAWRTSRTRGRGRGSLAGLPRRRTGIAET
jgi:hypothetical protein